MNIRKLIIRIAAVVFCLALAAVMMVIGRGHTVYLDNKTVEYDGQSYKSYYKVEVTVKGQDKPAKLYARERGSAKWIGQNFHMDLAIMETQDSEVQYLGIDMSLPYGMDGPIINIPALLAGLPADAYLSEFIPTPTVEEDVEDVELGDGFDVGEDLAGVEELG